MPTIEEMRAALKKDSQPSIEEMRAALKNNNQPIGINTAPGAFGRSINISGLKPEDLEKLKTAMYNNAPAIGATIGEMTPLGPIGLYGGAALGSAIKQYNTPPSSISQGAKNLAEDVGLNAVVPQAVGKGIRAGLNYAAPWVHSLPFGKLNELSRQKGKIPISDVLWKNRIAGGDKTLGQQAVDLFPKYNAARTEILNQIDAQGIKGDLKGAVQNGVDHANKLASSDIPEDQAIGKQLLSDIEAKYSSLYGSPETQVSKNIESSILDEQGKPITNQVTETIPAKEAPSATKMQRLKTLSGQGLPKEAWNKLSPASQTEFIKGQKIVGGGLKDELENMAGQVSPEAKSNLQNINAEQGALLTTAKQLNQNALTAYNKKHFSPVDAMAYTLGTIGDQSPKHTGGWSALALKKAGDLMKTKAPATYLGVGMDALGRSELPIVETGVRAFSPWRDLKYNNGEEQ